jgi:hypothetical protein
MAAACTRGILRDVRERRNELAGIAIGPGWLMGQSESGIG